MASIQARCKGPESASAGSARAGIWHRRGQCCVGGAGGGGRRAQATAALRPRYSSTTCPARLHSGQGTRPVPVQPLQAVPLREAAAPPPPSAAAARSASSARISSFCSQPEAQRSRSLRFWRFTCFRAWPGHRVEGG